MKDLKCEVVKTAWAEGCVDSVGFPISRCLEICRNRLEAWNKNDFRHVGRKISELQGKLEWLEHQPALPPIISVTRETRIDLNCWLDKEAAMWYQQSPLNWFQTGDQNARFFDARASSRYKKNIITGQMNSQGVWHEEEHKKGEIVVSYHKDLFCSNQPTEFTEILNVVQPRVSKDMNKLLNLTFQGNEVYIALKQMYPLKSPGPDGMPPLFFQHFWPTIGNTVTKTVLDFLNFGYAPPKFNDIHVVLIPENKDPKRISDYRPISLCNLIFKLASKVIANRLKKILSSIISETQSPFVHGRLITDNILVAFASHKSEESG